MNKKQIEQRYNELELELLSLKHLMAQTAVISDPLFKNEMEYRNRTTYYTLQRQIRELKRDIDNSTLIERLLWRLF